jgi:hypothetical protein
MSASIVPTVTLRPDGTYAVPVTPTASIVWGLRYDDGQLVLRVKVEQEGCKIYELHEEDSASVPIKP